MPKMIVILALHLFLYCARAQGLTYTTAELVGLSGFVRHQSDCLNFRISQSRVMYESVNYCLSHNSF